MTATVTKDGPVQRSALPQGARQEAKSRDWEALHAEDRQAATAVVGILTGIFTAALICYGIVVLWIVLRS